MVVVLVFVERYVTQFDDLCFNWSGKMGVLYISQDSFTNVKVVSMEMLEETGLPEKIHQPSA